MTKILKERERVVKSILISQPKPESERNPYTELAKNHNVIVDFRQFIHVEGVPGKEFRKARINPTDFTAIIFTSRNSIDHFFRICEEFKVKMPQTTKFFCISEAIALYLQKYTQYRKRKVFYSDGSIKSFTQIITKHKGDDKFLFPCSDIHKKDIPDFLEKSKIQFEEAVIYKTVASDLSDLEDITYDMVVFFSPSGVTSLYQNFPHFVQKETRISAFGPSTCKAVEDANLFLDVRAPMPNSPSMAMALDRYLSKVNKPKKVSKS